MEPWIRTEPLSACPDLPCRRKKICKNLAQGGACLKTHYRNKYEFYDWFAAQIRALSKTNPPRKNQKPMSEDEIMHGWRKALEKRLAECEALEAAGIHVP
jgi:hypothetical protein